MLSQRRLRMSREQDSLLLFRRRCWHKLPQLCQHHLADQLLLMTTMAPDDNLWLGRVGGAGCRGGDGSGDGAGGRGREGVLEAEK